MRPQESAKSIDHSWKLWWDVTKRSAVQIGNDYLQVAAAGVAFFFFLAFFPAIAATVSLYGLLFDPKEVDAQITQLASILPEQAQSLITQIGEHVTSRPDQALGLGIALSIVISIGSANKGAKALFDGLNLAYNERDERGFFTKTGLTLLFTFVSVILGLLAVALVAGFPAIVNSLPIPTAIRDTVNVARWPLAALFAIALISFAYRIAPDRERAGWRWIKWGSFIATGLWLIGSALFSYYVSNFGAFGRTYGSFAAVVVFMLWLFMTAFVILIGAEINAEMEKLAREQSNGSDEA